MCIFRYVCVLSNMISISFSYQQVTDKDDDTSGFPCESEDPNDLPPNTQVSNKQCVKNGVRVNKESEIWAMKETRISSRYQMFKSLKHDIAEISILYVDI